MSRRIRISFDPVAGRWEIADAEWAGRLELEPVQPGVAAGRGPDGTIVELVVDDDGGSVEVVRRVFGPAVGEVVRGHGSEDELDVTIETPWSPPTAYLVALPGEPGVPVVRSPGVYEVPETSGSLTVRFLPPVIAVEGRSTGRSDEVWVRVSDGDAGTLLALGSTRPGRDGRWAAEITFGLQRPVTSLHLSTGAEPLDEVGTRHDRRVAWATELLEDARRSGTRAATRLRSAERAVAVADTVDDPALRQRARAEERRIRRRVRRTRALLGGTGLVVVALLVAVPRFVGGSDPEPGGVVYYENCDAARAAGAAPLRRGEPGYLPHLDRDRDGIACES